MKTGNPTYSLFSVWSVIFLKIILGMGWTTWAPGVWGSHTCRPILSSHYMGLGLELVAGENTDGQTPFFFPESREHCPLPSQ